MDNVKKLGHNKVSRDGSSQMVCSHVSSSSFKTRVSKHFDQIHPIIMVKAEP